MAFGRTLASIALASRPALGGSPADLRPSAAQTTSAASRRGKTRARLLVVAAAACLALLLAAIVAPLSRGGPVEISPLASDDAVARVYHQARPAVVGVVDRRLPGSARADDPLGSGFVIDLDGHIITEHHVVEAVSDPGIVLSDGSAYPADLVGDDPAHDLAVLRAQIPAEKLHPLSLGDSRALRVGQRVIAIGGTFGLARSLTPGDISSLGRRTEPGGQGAVDDAIQTDAALASGSSGGPLLNEGGEVIGVDTVAVAEGLGHGEYGSTGAGFAIPSSLVRRMVPEMIWGALRAKAWLGLTAEDSQSESASQAVALESTARLGGAMLLDVVPGGPADAAQLQGTRYIKGKKSLDHLAQAGDIVIAIDGVRVGSADDLAWYMAHSGRQVGDRVTIRIVREGLVVDVLVRLRARSGGRAEPDGAM